MSHNGKPQRSKRARSEERALRWLRKTGQIARGIRHFTSHVSGGRGKRFRFAKDRME